MKTEFRPRGNKHLLNKSIPEKAGVYLFFSKQEIIYVGKAGNLRMRIAQHMGQPFYYKMVEPSEIDKVKIIVLNQDIDKTEKELIVLHKPKYNLYPWYKQRRGFL